MFAKLMRFDEAQDLRLKGRQVLNVESDLLYGE